MKFPLVESNVFKIYQRLPDWLLPLTTVARMCWHQKKVPSDSLVKMTLWTFVEAHITNIEMKHDALMKIAVNMHSLFGQFGRYFCLCTTGPQKGHHVLFQFWRIWLLQRSIEQLLSVKCLVLFLVSTQAGNSSVQSTKEFAGIQKCRAGNRVESKWVFQFLIWFMMNAIHLRIWCLEIWQQGG